MSDSGASLWNLKSPTETEECSGTLLAAQQPLNTLDELVSVAVRVNSNLLQLLVTHVSQHVQGDLKKRRRFEPSHT